MSDFSEIVSTLRTSFDEGILEDVNVRKKAIRNIADMLIENEEAIVEACKSDLRRPKAETMTSEITCMKREVNVMLANMDSWLTDESVSRSFITLLDTPYIQYQPLGLVLILGAWNYPVLMVIQPLIGAVAAGNTVILKPSEYAPACSGLVQRLIPKYLDKKICQVICGGVEVSQQLLAAHRFDHILYTGGDAGGRAVYAAAAKFLTPVTLELGGKSPAYVDSNVHLMMALRRILWSKVINAGQTCIATDYVLCHESVFEKFCEGVQKVLNEFYGEDPSKSPDYSRIVSARHFQRVSKLLTSTKGKIICGGVSNEQDLYIAPTVVVDVKSHDSLMSEEIFGPVLPVITVKSSGEAIDLIKQREKPLALYVYTNDSKTFDQFKKQTSSGALLQNDCCFHFVVEELPFGGVGGSGMGSYHGKYSIATFSHRRSVLLRSTQEVLNKRTIYPPYTESKQGWSSWALKNSASNRCTLM